MKKTLLLIPFMLSLIGCATTQATPKSEISLAEYKDRAERNGMYGICLRLELMDSNTYGKAISIGEMAIAKTGQTVDKGKLFDMTKEFEGEFVSLYNESMRGLDAQSAAIEDKKLKDSMRYDCQALGGRINTAYSEIQETQRNKSMQQRQTPTYQPRQSNNSTTSCNQFGSQVICNTNTY